MRKIIVVAMREFLAAVRTKAFLVSIFLMPVMMGGSIVVQTVMRNKQDITDKRFAVVDRTPGEALYATVEQKAAERNAMAVYEGQGEARKQIRPRFVVERVEPSSAADLDALNLTLSDRVRNGELTGFLVIGPDVLTAQPTAPNQPAAAGWPAPDDQTISYYSNTPTYDDFEEWAAAVLNEKIAELRLRQANLDPAVVTAAMRRAPSRNLGLFSRDVATGALKKAEETNRVAALMLPMGLMMLMFMVVLIGAQPLLQSALEEKMQRIAEVLLGCVTPFQLMMGKLIGAVGVTLTISTIYLVGAYLALDYSGFGALFPREVIWWFVLFQSLAVLMYGSMFLAAGAAASDMKEAQSLITPLMLVVVAPLFIWLNVVREPNAAWVTIASLIPPATPMLMVTRQAVPPGIPLWQPVLGVALVLLTTLLCVYTAARVFRVGILMQGKGANFTEMIRWAVRG